MNRAYNEDSTKALKNFPDSFFDLCVADPPYGLNVTSRHCSQSSNVEREREIAEHRLSVAEQDRSEERVARVYGESTKALANQNFILCSTTAPRRTLEHLGSYKE